MDELRTHRAADPRWCGVVRTVSTGEATATLRAIPEMAVDDRGLVHGSFVFGVVDLAAMAAVNDPNVVLGAADVRFRAPVRVGDEVVASARVDASDGKRRTVTVTAEAGGRAVLSGTLTAFVLDAHVLDG